MFAEHVLHEVGTNRQEKSLCGYWRNVALCQEIVQVQPMSGKEWVWPQSHMDLGDDGDDDDNNDKKMSSVH